MELIVGGSDQGKLAFVLESKGLNNNDVADGESADLKEICNKPILNRFHLLIKKWMKEEKDIYEQITMILEKNPRLIIITNELGCGIVPMEPFERRYREMTGRVCCKIAGQADRVSRVVCGIGTLIKE